MRINVGTVERIGSVAAGAALLYLASRRRAGVSRPTGRARVRRLVSRRLARLVEQTGTALLVRGLVGYCPINELAGRNSFSTDTRTALGGARGIHVLESVVVPVAPAVAYRFWRDLSNLPRFMSHLERVDVTDATHSHWVARAPAGLQVDWDAKIINDVENKLIGWRSLDHADVVSAGSVRFRPASGGTRITVHLQYEPPGGRLGDWIAEAFGRSPAQAIRADLARLNEELVRYQGQWGPWPLVPQQAVARTRS